MKQEEKVVLKNIEDLEESYVDFLCDLIRIKSVNPDFTDDYSNEEKKVQELLKARLEELGVKTDMWETSAKDLGEYRGKPGFTEGRSFDNRPNLVGKLKGSAGGGHSLFLTGHVDVVGADQEAWDYNPWEPTIRDGKIYGRGSADMKGGIAAMISAIGAIKRADLSLKGDLLIGTVVDEEAGGMGMLSLVDKGYSADAGIMTEPTNLSVSTLCRGVLWGRIVVEGRSGHLEVDQPHWRQGGAVDAIDKMQKVITAIEYLNDDWHRRSEKNHPLLPSPCQVKISQIEGGQHPSAYAETCQITIDAQYLPDEVDESGLGGDVRRSIEDWIQNYTKADPWLKENPPEIEWFLEADSAEIEVDSTDFIESMQNSLGKAGIEPELSGTEAHTDMTLLTKNGTPTVNFGPGRLSVAHQSNEYITKKDFIDATKSIALTILDWCGYK